MGFEIGGDPRLVFAPYEDPLGNYHAEVLELSSGLKLRVKNGKVYLVLRDWDGIDKPEHRNLCSMKPDRARFFAAYLLDAAKAAEEGKDGDDSFVWVDRW